MPYHTLVSAISRSRKQVIRTNRKLSDLIPQKSTFMAVLVVMMAMVIPLLLHAQRRDDSLQSRVQINSYIIKETGSSNVLMAKDVDVPVSPASLTKILTCIIAIESGRLDQDVLITKESTMVEPSKAGFRQGDKIKLVDLVKALLVEVGLLSIENVEVPEKEHLFLFLGDFIGMDGVLPENHDGGLFAFADLSAVGPDLLECSIDPTLERIR